MEDREARTFSSYIYLRRGSVEVPELSINWKEQPKDDGKDTRDEKSLINEKNLLRVDKLSLADSACLWLVQIN